MFFQRTINIFTYLLCSFVSVSAGAQSFQTSKYTKEYNPYFKFETFQRGVKSEILSKKLDALEAKDKNSWTISDSIEFAEISLLTKNIALSHYYLERLEKDNHHSRYAMKLLVMDCYIEKDFKTGDRLIKRHFNTSSLEDSYFSAIYFAHKKRVQEQKTDSVIFNIDPAVKTKIEKGSDRFQRQVIVPIETATKVLRFFVKYIHEDDPAMARAFNEIGLVLQKYVSLNQAYVSFSIARIYNSKDKEILNNVKVIKAEHINKNYNTPKFRSYFPRIEHWRFDYDLLKEKIIREKNDTIPKFIPELIQPIKKKELPFSFDLLIPIGMGIILLLIAIFTKSKKT